jgi:hypothetical protein
MGGVAYDEYSQQYKDNGANENHDDDEFGLPVEMIDDAYGGSQGYPNDDDFENDTEPEIVSTKTKNIKDALKDELVKAKFNDGFTSQLVLDNITNSFVILSNLMEDSNMAQQNAERIFSSLEKLRDVVDMLKHSADKMNNVNQIVEQLNILAIVISANNSNIENLIKVVGEINSKTNKMKKDVDDLNFNNFVGSKKSGPSQSDSGSFDKFLKYFNTVLLISMAGMLSYVLFF